jgi:LmbE family N-acetylglucosaminyl deacetylase
VSAIAILRRTYRDLSSKREAREFERFLPTLRVDPDAPALLLSPHWDDAVLDCWGLLSGRGPLEVVNLFAGTPPQGTSTLWDSITGTGDSVARTRERMAEDALALGLAGRAPVNLPLLEAQYRSGNAPRMGRLDEALVAHVSAASHLYAPAGIGSHPDHLLARSYARALLRAGMPVTLYAELPYCVLHGWPHWVDSREQEPNRDVEVFWRSFLGELGEMPELRAGDVRRLDDEQTAKKLAAMRCYATQLPALSYGARGLLEDPEISRYEVSWRRRVG